MTRLGLMDGIPASARPLASSSSSSSSFTASPSSSFSSFTSPSFGSWAITFAATASTTRASALGGAVSALAVLGGGLLTSTALAEEDQSKPDPADGAASSGEPRRLLSLDTRRTHFFYYEKRLREMSSQRKIFDYFCSIRPSFVEAHARLGNIPDGGRYMTAHDLIRAIEHVMVPHSSNLVRNGCLEGEPFQTDEKREAIFARRVPAKLWQILGKDPRQPSTHFISFADYLVIYCLSVIDVETASAVFDVIDDDGSGTLDSKEFSQTLDDIMSSMYGGKDIMDRAGGSGGDEMPSSSSSSSSPAISESISRTSTGILDYLFGKRRNKTITAKQFGDFLHELKDILCQLEFNHYDADDSGTISGRALAVIIASNARADYVRPILERLENMPDEMAMYRVSLKQVLALEEVCRQYRRLVAAMRFFSSLRSVAGEFNEARFVRLANRLTGIQLDPIVARILFFSLDKDGNGNLDFQEVDEILGAKVASLAGQSGAENTSLWDCLRTCVRQSASGKKRS